MQMSKRSLFTASVFALPVFVLSCGGPARPVKCPTVPKTKSVSAGSKAREVGALVLDGIPPLPQRIRDRMRQYQGVRRASFVDWDEKGGGMLISTRFGDTTQIHRVKSPLAARQQLTFYREPVRSASWIPGSYDGAVLLLMDQGGAENNQLYRYDMLEGKTTRLTDGKSRTVGYRWSSKGKLAYSNNARNGRDFDIYVTAAKKPGEAKLVYEGRGLFMPLDWSPDESKLLLLQYISLNETYLHILDVASGKTESIGPPPPAKGDPAPAKADAKKAAKKDAKKAAKKGAKKAAKKGAKKSAQAAEKSAKKGAKKAAPAQRKPTIAFRKAVWDGRGRGVFLTSDRDGEFVQLYYYDLKKKAFTSLSKDVPWNIEGIALSSDGRNLAVTVNEGGLSKLYVMDARRGARSRLGKPVKDVPDGIIRNLKFAKARKQRSLLGFTVYRPTSPGDAYAYDVRRRKLEPWTKSEVGGLNSDFFVAPKLIKYPTFDKVDGKPRQIPAFYFKPSGAGPRPVMIYIHGGPEAQYRPYFHPLVHYLLMEMGVAIIAPNVRGSDGYGKSYLLLDNGMKRADSVKDIGALLDWIQGQKELDASKVVVYGGSYGGFMVLSSLVNYADRLRAGVDWVGISNFVTFLKNTKAYRRDLRRAEYGDERIPAMRKYLEEVSPLNHVDKISSPLFVIQGANDPRVPQSEAEQIVKAMRKKGRKVWYMLAKNEGHGFRKKTNRDMAYLLTALFLEEVGVGKSKSK